ncbi:hypothetical protein C8J57DRAFT_1563916 [Mycena rebaudengoi]|nr:hypothetical protein C8J57DRAFT_1563916 [Mycena rebaudengoi]
MHKRSGALLGEDSPGTHSHLTTQVGGGIGRRDINLTVSRTTKTLFYSVPNHHVYQRVRVGGRGREDDAGEGGERDWPRGGGDGEGALGVDRHRERTPVGNLTNSYKFKQDGFIKWTYSFWRLDILPHPRQRHAAPHFVLKDRQRRVRPPARAVKLASLGIAPTLLEMANFAAHPKTKIGVDGVPRYRGEADEVLAVGIGLGLGELGSGLASGSRGRRGEGVGKGARWIWDGAEWWCRRGGWSKEGRKEYGRREEAVDEDREDDDDADAEEGGESNGGSASGSGSSVTPTPPANLGREVAAAPPSARAPVQATGKRKAADEERGGERAAKRARTPTVSPLLGVELELYGTADAGSVHGQRAVGGVVRERARIVVRERGHVRLRASTSADTGADNTDTDTPDGDADTITYTDVPPASSSLAAAAAYAATYTRTGRHWCRLPASGLERGRARRWTCVLIIPVRVRVGAGADDVGAWAAGVHGDTPAVWAPVLAGLCTHIPTRTHAQEDARE